MIITQIEEWQKNRYKIFIEEQFAFVLYKGELSRYHLKVDSIIEEEVYQEILQKIIIVRAKKRTLYLLEKMMRSEHQIRMKLKQSFYTDEVIDEAIQYGKKFGYINDDIYVRMFIDSKRKSKSKKEVYALLLQKGIDRDLIKEILDEVYCEECDEESIQNIIRKKRFNPLESTELEKKKIYEYLRRKGFQHASICKVIRVLE